MCWLSMKMKPPAPPASRSQRASDTRLRESPSIDRVRSTLVRLSTDIVLIDLPINSESGLETVAEIKALYPASPSSRWRPVNSASVALAAVHCGASDYLNKPFTVDELASSLERAGGQPLGYPDPPAAGSACASTKAWGKSSATPTDGEALSHPFKGRANHSSGPDPGRERHGQGTHRAYHPYLRTQPRKTVSTRGLRLAGSYTR